MNILTDSITTKTCVGFFYSDKPRFAEIHAVGLGKDDKTMVRAWERNEGAWKLFSADKMVDLTPSTVTSLAPRPGFAPGDKAMSTLIAEVTVA